MNQESKKEIDNYLKDRKSINEIDLFFIEKIIIKAERLRTKKAISKAKDYFIAKEKEGWKLVEIGTLIAGIERIEIELENSESNKEPEKEARK